MERDDGRVPAPRRAVLPLRRRPAPIPTEPRVADLSALLGEIDTLRTTLQTDLSLAAAALDAGVDELAGELVDSDLRAVHDFEARALAHLSAMEESAADPARTGRRRRLMPAAPALVAAAALVGFALGVVPDRGGATPAPAMSSAAEASYELSRLALEGAPSEELRAAAEQLNDEVVELVARSGGSPATAAEALMMLRRSTDVLVNQGDQEPLQAVLAEARQLAEQLRRALPPEIQRSLPPMMPLPALEQEPSGERSGEPTRPRRSTTTPQPQPEPSTEPSPSEPGTPASPPGTPTPQEPDGSGGDDRPVLAPEQIPGF